MIKRCEHVAVYMAPIDKTTSSELEEQLPIKEYPNPKSPTYVRPV